MKGKLPLSAVLLAGGESKRMGTRKAFLKIGDDTFIDVIHRKVEALFLETIVVTDIPEELSYLNARLTTDLILTEKKNAMRGIHAGLSIATYPACFITGCDMPLLSLSLIEYMSQFAMDYEAVVPVMDGFYQPLFAFYNKSKLEFIEQRLISNNYRLTDLFQHFHLKTIEEDIVREHDPLLLSFANINSPEDYQRVLDYWNGGDFHGGTFKMG